MCPANRPVPDDHPVFSDLIAMASPDAFGFMGGHAPQGPGADQLQHHSWTSPNLGRMRGRRQARAGTTRRSDPTCEALDPAGDAETNLDTACRTRAEEDARRPRLNSWPKPRRLRRLRGQSSATRLPLNPRHRDSQGRDPPWRTGSHSMSHFNHARMAGRVPAHPETQAVARTRTARRRNPCDVGWLSGWPGQSPANDVQREMAGVSGPTFFGDAPAEVAGLAGEASRPPQRSCWRRLEGRHPARPRSLAAERSDRAR